MSTNIPWVPVYSRGAQPASPVGAAPPAALLNLLDPPPVERPVAARNRRRVLIAAERLFAERGIDGVTMDDVAAAAGVGKGTLYRRFATKAGLGVALLDERERALQQAILSGPPPLGPGAPPADRLAAFTSAYLAFADSHLAVVRMSEASGQDRYSTGVYRLWHTHCRLLLTAAGAADPDARADLLLAGLAGEIVAHRRHARGDTLPDLQRAWASAARALAAPPPAAHQHQPHQENAR
jgi:AcrR family transcriptional regulator